MYVTCKVGQSPIVKGHGGRLSCQELRIVRIDTLTDAHRPGIFITTYIWGKLAIVTDREMLI